jgi:hypothetical protein
MANLRREIATLKAEHLALARRPTGTQDSARAPELTPEQAREEETLSVQRFAQNLDDTLRAQRRDVKWASETEHQVENSVSKYAPATTLDTVTCASNLCRVVVKHSDGATRREFLQKIGEAEPFTGGTIYSYDGMVTTMYVTKPGDNFTAKPPSRAGLTTVTDHQEM